MLLLDVDDAEDALMSWTRFVTAGEVESMAVLPDTDQDAVYMSVKRTPRAITQDAAYETETNADLLMGNDSAGWAMDFTDGSFTVRWPDEPTHQDRISGKTIVVDGRRGTGTREDGILKPLIVEDYGNPPGPDEYNMAWFNFLGHWSQPIYTRQADGTLKLQQHNYLNRTEQIEAPKTGYPGPYTLYDVLNTNYGLVYENVDINSDQDTFLSCDGENNVTISPRGDMTGGRLFSDTRTGIDGQHYIGLDFQVAPAAFDSYAYSAPFGWFSFSAKPAELSVMEVAFHSFNASFGSFISHHPEDVGTGSSQSGSCITYRIDLSTGDVTKVFEDHAFTTQDLYIYEVDVEEQPNGWYRYHFKYSEHEDSAWRIRLLDENLNRSFVADGKGIYIWGLQDKCDGTDDHRTYLRQYDNFFAFPSSGSQRQQLMPYEWDEDGNCLGVRYYDWDIDFVGYWNNDFAFTGAVGYFGEGTPVDGDTTGYTGRIDHGTSYTNSSKLGPDNLSPAGIWTDDGGGYTTTTGSCGIDIPRTYYEDGHSGQACASIFVKYDGSARYFTISHWNGFPSEDTWYSVTWDVVTGEVTEEYYEPGNATGTAVITNRHTKAGEWYANGWFRLMSSCRFEYQGTSNARVYWAMSTVPNQGATNRGVQAAATTGDTIQVWYPMLHANHGYQQAVAGPPRPPKLSKSYEESPGAVIPIGKDAGYYQYHGDRTDKEVLPINYDCWRFEQTVVPIDAWFDPEHFNTYLAETRPYDEYFGWPSVYSGYDETESGFDFDAETVTNSFFGTLWQMSDDPKFDFVGYYKYAGLLGSPNEELAGFVTAGFETWYPPTKFTSFPPDGADPIPALAFELNKEYTSVINLIENYGVEMYMNGVYIGADETLAPNFVETVNNVWQVNGSSLFYTGESDSSFAFDGYAHGHRQFYLKQLKVTSQCGPDEPRFIERLNKHDEALGGVINKMADAGNYFAGPVSSVVLEQHAGFGGLVAWGTRVSDGFTGPIPGPLGATSSGRVELGDTYTDVFIGLPYTARYKSAKLAYAGQGGTALEQPKKITEFGLLLNDAHVDAIKYGEDFDRMRSMPRIYKGKPVEDGTIWSEYDDVSFSMPGSWNTDSRLCLKVEAPYPATFTGLVISVETNSRGGR